MKTLLVGLTGGIGAGKSLCADIFHQLGVPIYNTDSAAKRLMTESSSLISQIIDLFGDQAYEENGRLNRVFLANKIFNNAELLAKMNQAVHPAVRDDFSQWVQSQINVAYILQESALLFETQSYRLFDKTILVSAPLDIRIERTVARDHVTAEQVKQRMAHQWVEERKLPLADYVIYNDKRGGLIRQIVKIHLELSSLGQIQS